MDSGGTGKRMDGFEIVDRQSVMDENTRSDYRGNLIPAMRGSKTETRLKALKMSSETSFSSVVTELKRLGVKGGKADHHLHDEIGIRINGHTAVHHITVQC